MVKVAYRKSFNSESPTTSMAVTIDDKTDEELETTISVLAALKQDYDLDSDEYADISQTEHYARRLKNNR